MKILLVADSPHLFLRKYIQGACAAFNELGQTPLVLCTPPACFDSDIEGQIVTDAAFHDWCRSKSPQRFTRAFELAKQLGAQRVHICFFNDADALWRSIDAQLPPSIELSISIFGLGAFRDSAYEAAYHKLIARRVIAKTLLHSNNPEIAKMGAATMGLLDAGRVHYLHDPIYDDPRLFKHKKNVAREQLGIDPDKKIVLYYGTFPKKKGADLLLETARHSADRNTCFLFAGSLSASDSGCLTKGDFDLPNVRLDDRVIDEADTGLYFCSADLIALPYRRFYELDTSGVFVQSCLARRPMVVPNFAPFRQTVDRFRLGGTFRCDDACDLGRGIRALLDDAAPDAQRGFDEYIASLSSWTDFASAILGT